MRRVSSELALPEPIKARILLELAADLESLYEHYRRRGVDEAEAVRLTEERLLMSPESLHHLTAIYTTSYQRWINRAAQGFRWGFEALLFAFGAVPIVGLAVWLVATQAAALAAQPLGWPLLAILAAVWAGIGWKAWQLYLRRVRSPAELHRGLSTLLFLGVLGAVWGGTAFLIRLYELALRLSESRAGSDTLLRVLEPLAQGAALLGMGLLVGIGSALVWFVLVNRVAIIEQAESAALLAQ